MITLRFDQLVRTTGGTLYNTAHGGRRFRGVSIDSRTLKPGELFIALRGEQNDGHDFIGQAMSCGAAGVLAQFDYPLLNHIGGDVPVVAVVNSHEAMMTLAESYRSRVAARRVGITGSNGKTTTKELAYRLLSAVETNVYCSPGNFNNLFGMPLSLLAMPQETKVAVLEMGISVPGEMDRLSRMVRPDVMVYTNVSPSHLRFLDTVEGVARAKLEAVQTMSADQPVIVNADDELLVKETKRVRADFVSFGVNREATFRPTAVEPHGSGGTVVTIDERQFHLPMFGHYQVYNLLAAYAITRTLGYSFENVDTLSLELQSAPMRGETRTSRGVTFIVDCYNANPESVKCGLKSLAGCGKEKRLVIVLGDMLELGRSSQRYHREAGQQLAGVAFEFAAVVGPMARFIADEAHRAGIPSQKIKHFDTAASCAEELKSKLAEGDLVYIKGSRGVGLEAILQEWVAPEEEA